MDTPANELKNKQKTALDIQNLVKRKITKKNADESTNKKSIETIAKKIELTHKKEKDVKKQIKTTESEITNHIKSEQLVEDNIVNTNKVTNIDNSAENNVTSTDNEIEVGEFIRAEHISEKTDSDIYEDLATYSYEDITPDKKENKQTIQTKKAKGKKQPDKKVEKKTKVYTLKKDKKPKTKTTLKEPSKFFSVRTLFEFLVFTSCFIYFEIIAMVNLHYVVSFPYVCLFLFTDTLLFLIINLFRNWKLRFTTYTITLIFFFAFTIFSLIYLNYKKDGIGLEMLPELKVGFQFTSSESSGAYSPILLFGAGTFFSLCGILIAFLVGLFFATFKNNRVKNTKLHKIGSICFYCAFVITNVCVANVSVPYGKVAFDKYFSFQNIGVLNYLIQDINGFAYREIVEKNTVYYLEPETKSYSTTSSLCEGKNVIQIMMEEIDNFLISEEMTPNLYALLNGGVKYPNFYSAYSYLSTYDAEYKSLTSGMGYTGSNYYLDFGKNTFNNAIPNVLSSAGYTTIGMHNFQRTFFDRNEVWQGMGFDETYFIEEMSYLDKYEYRKDWFETFPYPDFPPDSYMFQTMQDKYAPTDLDNPFYTFILTVGSHQPFYKYRTVLADYYTTLNTTQYKDYPDEYKNKLVCAMDLDVGIGAMMQHLTENNMLDDTVIVIYTDHHSYNDEDTFEGFREPLTNEYDIFKCPFTIYNPSTLGSRVDTTLTSHYDLVPTILDLVGVSYNTDYYYGQSLFSTTRDDRPIIFGATKWMDSVMYERNFTPHLKTGISMTDSEMSEHYKTVSDYVWKTVKKFNYFLYSDYFKTHIQTTI